MNRSKRVAVALIVGLVWSKTSGLAQLRAAPDFRSDHLVQRIETFGTGAEVSIELQNGKKIRGTLDFFDVSQIRLIDKGQSIAFENGGPSVRMDPCLPHNDRLAVINQWTSVSRLN